MAPALLALIGGAWLGLVRLGWPLPLPWPEQLIAHGPLMTGGFLGTLIGLERAIAFGRWWAYGAPVFTGAAAIALLLSLGDTAAPTGMTLGSGLLTAASLVLWRRFRSLGLALMTLAAAAWTTGNAWWLARGSVSHAAWWWLGFLVLTIAGERLELSRLLAPRPAVQRAFLAFAGVVLTGIALTAGWPELGARVLGTGLVGLAGWLARYDVARRSLRRPGQSRYIALCLLAAYAWLAIGGALAAATGAALPGPRRDALLHAIFLGFALSMVFGHAPVVLPAVLERPVPFRRSFYVPLVLLHASLVIRVTGDLSDLLARWRAWGGLLNAVALLAFVVHTLWAVRLGSTASSA
ncbi:MAG TPA: hypothetical protein VNI83_13650 [Vicinamibacterales bacterium]|nr:hypothetical protein [Vicinamibacterales bacterium]